MVQFLYMLYTTGAINQVYGIIGIGLFIIGLWQWTRKNRLHIKGVNTLSFFLLVLFASVYVLIGELSIQGVEFFLVCPIIAYLCGCVTIESGKDGPEHNIKKCIIFMLLGYAIHATLNLFINIGQKRWDLVDFFTGDFRSATGSGCINTLIFSLFAYFIVLEKNKLIKWFGITGTVLSALYAFILGTRTQFAIFAIVSFVFLFFYYREKYGITFIVRLCLVLAVITCICVFAFNKNLFGLRSYIEDSNLVGRYIDKAGLSDSDDYRISSVSRGFITMFKYPFGGLKETTYYHNFWLDIGRVSGIIPFVIMVCYTVVVNIHLIRIFRNKDHEPRFRYLLFCVYLGIQLNFLTEPILEGFLSFYLVFTIINGMVEYYYYFYELNGAYQDNCFQAIK